MLALNEGKSLRVPTIHSPDRFLMDGKGAYTIRIGTEKFKQLSNGLLEGKGSMS